MNHCNDFSVSDLIDNNKEELFEYYIKSGEIFPNSYYFNNCSILTYSLMCRKINLSKILVKNGADINFKNELGNTSLSCLIDYEMSFNSFSFNKDSFKFLLENGAKNIPNNKGETPFTKIIRYDSLNLLRLFLTHLTYDELVGD